MFLKRVSLFLLMMNGCILINNDSLHKVVILGSVPLLNYTCNVDVVLFCTVVGVQYKQLFTCTLEWIAHARDCTATSLKLVFSKCCCWDVAETCELAPMSHYFIMSLKSDLRLHGRCFFFVITFNTEISSLGCIMGHFPTV